MSGRPGPIGRARARAGLLGVVALAALAGVAVCGRTNLEPARDTRGDPLPPNPLQPPHPVPAHLPSGALLTRFAVIGDYGIDSEEEAKVARLVSNWNPDFVITTGDNNYPVGAAETIDANIGKYYWRFIGNYRGAYGQGSATNRFWPSPGNHDWDTGTLAPYLNYFTLPGNGRYYDTVVGPVHLFALDSDPREPDGTTADSIQGRWLKAALASSTSCHDIVYFHHPAYSSGPHGSSFDMRWPFEAWGADVVLAGHDHTYERSRVGGIRHFVIGVSGHDSYAFGTPLTESEVRVAGRKGALLVTVRDDGIAYQFFAHDGSELDTFATFKPCRPSL